MGWIRPVDTPHADGDIRCPTAREKRIRYHRKKRRLTRTRIGRVVTPEQRAQIEKMRAQQLADYVAKWGEPPSPDASYQHYRDNHGDVHRHYRGTVAISDYDYRTKFAPTPAELERYKQLHVDLHAAVSADERNGGSAANPSAEGATAYQ